jgi:UDP-N-acetylglucosamine 2-epimerase (non-hydrolysing)
MILVVFGTTGELIKLAPVLLRLREGGHAYLLATTGQQVRQIPGLLEQFDLPQPDIWLGRGANGHDLRVNSDIPGWLRSVIRSYLRRVRSLRRRLRAGPGKPAVLVHGDTLTSVFGAVVGRTLGIPVAHIESGLRSFDLRHPFPEELNRRLASSIARIHYAPGGWAAANLYPDPDVVNTRSNTMRDSIELVADGPLPFALPSEPYGIVSLHRFELINNRRLLTENVQLLRQATRRSPMFFIDHPVTAAALERFGLDDQFDERFVRIGRLRFFEFIRAERGASFVITDSGGSQEECYYLDLPCLVHRVKTERREGLGENAVLSGMRTDVLRDFLADPSRFRRVDSLPPGSPSQIIVDDLVRRGFAARRGHGA